MSKPLTIAIQEMCQQLIEDSVPLSANNADPLLAEMFVAKEAKTFFEKKYDKVKDAVVDQFVDKTQLVSGAKFIAVQGEKYELEVRINQPSKSLDKEKLRRKLAIEHKMSDEQVDALFEACSVEKAGAKYFTAQPIV